MSRNKAQAPLGVAGLIAGIVAVAVVLAPGTLSYFVSSTESAAVAVSTGQAALSVTGTGGSTTVLYPGGPAQLIATRSIANTGDVPLALAPALSTTGALASSVVLTVSVQTSACAPVPPSSWPADTGVWQGTAAGLTLTVPTTLAAASRRTLCVWQALDANAPDGTQGQTAATTITFSGTQTAP